MPIFTPEEFCDKVPKAARLLSLDVGSKTIGLATGTRAGTGLAMPLATLRRVKFTKDAEGILKTIRDYEVAGLVIGWPLNTDGSVGKRCQSVRDFGVELDRFLTENGVGLPTTFWDERFSTAIGENLLEGIGDNRRTLKEQNIDALAAQQILQAFIEGMGGIKNTT